MKNSEQYKNALEAELKVLESELGSVGMKNPENSADWIATPPKSDVWKSDEEETADNIDGYETNTGILKQLEIRFNEVKAALERIKNGTYGICSVCGEEIEEKRLSANPAATTCLKHM